MHVKESTRSTITSVRTRPSEVTPRTRPTSAPTDAHHVTPISPRRRLALIVVGALAVVLAAAGIGRLLGSDDRAETAQRFGVSVGESNQAPVAARAETFELAPARAAADSDRTDAVPIWTQVVERQRLGAIVEHMPAGWPAAEVMRRAAGQPLGEAVGRAHWRQDAERMPAGWPAAEVMRRAAHGLADYREARASVG
jgi:hypothetical protein